VDSGTPNHVHKKGLAYAITSAIFAGKRGVLRVLLNTQDQEAHSMDSLFPVYHSWPTCVNEKVIRRLKLGLDQVNHLFPNHPGYFYPFGLNLYERHYRLRVSKQPPGYVVKCPHARLEEAKKGWVALLLAVYVSSDKQFASGYPACASLPNSCRSQYRLIAEQPYSPQAHS
jgi:hypothetical protein